MKFFTPLFVAFAMIAFLSIGTPVSAHCGSCGASETNHEHIDKVKKGECALCEPGKPCQSCSADKVKDSKSSKDAKCSHCKPGKPCAHCAAKKGKGKTGAAINKAVPSFTLPDSSGKEYSLKDYNDKVKVIIFFNQNCPYVVEANDRIDEFAKAYKNKGVEVMAVDAGINNSTEEIASHQKDVSFPILVNSKSDLAKKFGAKRTPEVYVLDKNNKLVYTGMFDSGQNVDDAGNRKTPTKDAVDAVLAGEEVKVPKTKAFGCSIKFKK